MLVAARAAAFLQHKDFGIIHRAARPPVSRSAAFPFALGLLGWLVLVYHSIRMARNFTQVIELSRRSVLAHRCSRDIATRDARITWASMRRLSNIGGRSEESRFPGRTKKPLDNKKPIQLEV